MKWNEMNPLQRVLCVVGIVCSSAALVLCVLSIANIFSNGLNYALLLLGVSNIASGIGDWKRRRGMAIFGFAVAAFLIISQIVVLLIL